MIHKMKLQDVPFRMIDSGQKTIEMRLYDEKRQKVNLGDTIEFSNENFAKNIRVKVIKLHHFTSFEELYNAFDKTVLGYNEEDEASASDMSQYYNAEEIQKYGVVGIEIKKL